jgi:hypothetical protein
MNNDENYWEQRFKGLNDQYLQLKNAYIDLKEEYSEQFRINDMLTKENMLLKQKFENVKAERTKAMDSDVERIEEINRLSSENYFSKKKLEELEHLHAKQIQKNSEMEARVILLNNEIFIMTQKNEELREKIDKLEKQEIRRSSNSESLNEFSRSVCSKMPKMLGNLSLFMPNNGLRDRNLSDLSTVVATESQTSSIRSPFMTPGRGNLATNDSTKPAIFERNTSQFDLSFNLEFSLSTSKTPQANPDQGLEDESCEARFFEAFFVLGVPDSKLGKSHSPAEILYKFEGSCESFNKNILADFCFPSDPKRRQLRESTSEEDINNILFGQDSEFRSCNCYIFTLISSQTESTPTSDLPNSDKQYIYCICVQFEDIAIENQTRSEWINTKCLCLVSFVPCFELHFKFLNSLLQLKKLWRMETIAEFDNIRASLRSNQSEDYPPKWEEMLLKYFRFDEITPGCKVCIEDSLAPCIEFQFVEDLSLIDMPWLVHSLRSAIDGQTFLSLFSALLQEKSIVFVSYNLDLLTSCVLGMLALLRPCKWPYFFMPLIPDNLRDLLEAPIPILAGIPGSAPDNRKNLNHIVWVLLDECLPTRKIANPETLQDVHELPASHLRQEFLACYAAEAMEVKVAAVLKKMVSEIFERFMKKMFYHPDEIQKAVSDNFAVNDQNFYHAITQTQIFYSRIEKWIAW